MVRLSEDEWSAVQAAPPTTYSLGGSGLDNLITGGSYDPSYDDGLGHYWDSAIQGWRNKSDGSVYSPNQGYDYSADPGLGVYGDQGSYQPPNYSLGFGGSPVTSYTNPDANGDGLNDANGWAVGVIQDYASPTGFSYNGQPTYSNGSPYVENTYQQPGGDWYNYDQYKDSGTGWDTYNLNNPGLPSPDLNYQTPEDAITALRRRGQYVPNDISRADLAARVAALGTPIGDGSFGQGLKDFAGAAGTAATDIISAPQKYVGGPLAQAAWDNPGTAISTALNPMAGLQNLGIQSLLNPGGAQDKYQQYYDANQEVLNNPDTNPFLREGYRTLTDPLTYLGPTAAAKLIPGEGTAANVIRSLVDQGGIEAVLGGNLGAVAANTDTAQNIPYFGDQPAWLRGIEGGVIGGLGAAGFAGTLKATAENTAEGGLKRALGQAGEATTPGPDEALARVVERARRAEASPLEHPGFNNPPKLSGDANVDALLARIPAVERSVIKDIQIYPTEADAAEALRKMGVPGATGHGFGGYIVASADNPSAVPHELGHALFPNLPESLQAKWEAATGRKAGESVIDYLNRAGEGNWPPTAYGVSSSAEDFADSYAIWRLGSEAGREQLRPLSPGREAFFREMDAWLGGASKATASDTTLNPIRRKVADALDEELKWRNSGEAEAIKATKRAEQAAGLNAVEAGATSAETLANVSAGARVGKFFDNTPGLKLSETDYNAALTDLVNSTEGFDKIQAVKALDKLQNGERLQPAEIKTLGKLYGPEIEAKIRATNADRVSSIAELTDADKAQIARQAEVDGKRVATLEVQAKRQHELADNLNQRSLMNPTNKQLKTAAEDARARAIKAENDADRILADRAEKATSGFTQRTQDAPRVAETQATGTAKQAEAADRRALRAENKARIKAEPEQMVTKAKDVVAKLDVSDNLKSQLIDTIELGARKQRIILDGMGEEGPGILRKIYAATTGEVTDSYTSKLLTQRAFIQNALESQGISREAAKQIGKLLQDAELRLKYGDNIPKWVTDSLEQAKFSFAEGGAIKGLADISQELKNTQFGIGDMAVFGQQAAKAGLTNAPQIVTGYVNRALQALHLGGVDTALPESAIARDTQYALDGLALHSHAITDIVNNERTLLSRLGPAGKLLDDKVALPAIKKLTDFQFDTVLGNLRKTIYEGNLVMAKLSGADITDPIVRQRAAEMANAATGAGKLAQRTGRANAEKAFALSASVRRAQIQQVGQVIKGLSHQDTALSSAMAIASSVGMTLAVGKLLSDYTDIPFEMDPSKKGFGNIRLPDGTTINPFSQEQIAKAFARSIRILAENPTDGKSVAEEWGKILVSSASPAIRPFLASVGVGIDQNGYHWGDLGQGQSFGQRLLNASPIPPLASSIIQNGVSPVRTPLEALGVNAYPESKYDVRDRQSMEMFGVPYAQQTPDQRVQFTDKNGKLPYANPQVQKALEAVTTAQQGADAELATGTFTPAKAQAWRDQYTTNKDNLRFFKDQVYADAGTKPGSDPQLDAYYKVIDQNTAQSGKVNWDAVDAYKKALPDGGKYIDTHTGFLQIDTPTTRAFETAKDTIESSGFFDKRDKAWAAIQAQVPEAQKYASYDEWYNAKLEAAQKEWAGQATPEYIDKEARKLIDKMLPAQGMKEYGNIWENGWIQANPAAAYLAWKWGYFVPTEEQAKWINNEVGAK